MSPLGKGESVGEYVAESLRIIQRSGLDYRLHAMGTIIEGEWDQVFAVAKECFEATLEETRRPASGVDPRATRFYGRRKRWIARNIVERITI